MSRTKVFYMGAIKELHSSIGGPAYASDAPGHFVFNNAITIHDQGQVYTFNGISIGPYFAGSLSFDKDIPHDGKFNAYFSSGHEAYGDSRLSLNNTPQKLDFSAQGWFKPRNNDSYLFCDPVVYFTLNKHTHHGDLRFEFTDLWNGVLECTIDCFIQRH